MIKITRFFYVHILTFPLFFLAYWVGALQTLLMAYCIVTVHELFHLFAALLLKVRVGCIVVMPFGMTLRLSAHVLKSPKNEALIAMAGPAANACMLLLGLALKQYYIWAEQSMFLYEYLNWITMILNLLPVLPLDGGRILRAVLTHSFGYLRGMKWMRKLTKIMIFILALVGTLLLILTRCNISLVMVAAFLIFNMIEEKKTSDLFAMKELMGAKEKLLKQSLMASKVISATENTAAKQILKRISYDNYCLVYIENSDGKGRIISESELVRAILEKGYQLKLKQIV